MQNKQIQDQTFEGLTFEQETFTNCQISDATFKNCNFRECKLSQTRLSGCTFENCNILDLISENNSSIQFTSFKNCHIASVNIGTLLSSGKFPTPISALERCKLKYLTFTNMDIKKFDFSDNEITHSIFAQCNLSESKFANCQLQKTEFYKSNLQKSDFRDALGYQIDIMSCNLKDAKFSLPEVLNLLNVLDIKLY